MRVFVLRISSILLLCCCSGCWWIHRGGTTEPIVSPTQIQAVEQDKEDVELPSYTPWWIKEEEGQE